MSNNLSITRLVQPSVLIVQIHELLKIFHESENVKVYFLTVDSDNHKKVVENEVADLEILYCQTDGHLLMNENSEHPSMDGEVEHASD